jgi:catechol 2,3-dioxygenase-like lactoylglutathione lyase family enzyme
VSDKSDEKTGPRVGPNRDLGEDGRVVGGLSVSVRHLEASVDFYRALGFSVGETFDVLPAYGPMLEAPPGFRARAVYVRRDGVAMELVEFASPPAQTSASAGLAAQIGLAHIRFHVDDLGRMGALVSAHGGRVLDETRIVANTMAYVFCTDPDGVRLLVSAPVPA